MCMEDIRLGREMGAMQLIVPALATSFLLLDADKHRTNIIFLPPPSGILTISVRNPTIANEGITLDSTSHPLELSIQCQGNIVKNPWYAIHSAGGIKACVIATSLDKH